MKKKFNTIAKYFAVAVLAIGGFALAGWIFDIGVFKHILPGMVDIKANTAIGFVLLGMPLSFYLWMREESKIRQLLTVVCALVVFALGVATILEYFFGFNFGIDQIFFKEASTAILTSSPGRMALNTAINFSMAGLGLYLLTLRKTIYTWITQFIAVLIGGVGLVSIVGYTYNADPLFIGLHYSTAMALHTSVGFLFFGVALIFSTSSGMMKIIVGQEAGSKLFRRLIPIAIVFPLILGWWRIHLANQNVLNDAILATFFAVLSTAFVSAYLFALSFLMNIEDTKRKFAEQKLMNNESLLREAQKIAGLGSYRLNFITGNIESSNFTDSIFGINETYEHTITGWVALIHPSDQDMIRDYLTNEVVAKRKPFNKEYRIIRKDDQIEHWVHGLGRLELDPTSGNPVEMLGTVQDITERKKREIALAAKFEEIDKLNRFMVGREVKMAELKKENEELRVKVGEK